MTTLSDAVLTNAWQLLQPHPSACQSPCDSNDSDYHDLGNVTVDAVQHTVCCHRLDQESRTCRFNLPRELCEVNDIQFQELSNDTVRATLSTKRNNPRLNSHQ